MLTAVLVAAAVTLAAFGVVWCFGAGIQDEWQAGCVMLLLGGWCLLLGAALAATAVVVNVQT